MKRWLVAPLVALAMALVPLAAAADQDGGGDGTHHFGPFASGSPDSGTCGNDWAADTFDRNFFVRPNADGTFAVRESFRNGQFSTLAGASPGACEVDSDHGSLIVAGVKGPFTGFLDGTVTGGTFNPGGCDVPASCGTTAGFVAAVFGPSATYSCITGVGACSFFFSYHAAEPALKFRFWINASTDLGGNRGDIASS